MEYAEFRTEHEAVRRACLSAQLDAAGLRSELGRLEGLRDTLAEPAARWQADLDLDQLRDLLRMAEEPAPPVSQAQLDAMAVASRASDPSGTTEERIARLRSGVAEIRAIADRVTDVSEQYAVLRQAEPLESQASAMEWLDQERGR
jgi:hypothetical protein